MKKILILVLIVLLVLMGYFSFTKGIKVLNFEIASVDKIKKLNEKVEKEIEDTNKIINTEYPNKISSVNTELKKLSNAKNKYVDIVNISSPEEIVKANQEETYSIEFLWAKIGNHATDSKIDLKFEVVSSGVSSNLYNLKFTVNGDYMPIMNFIYAIEDDEELYYRIKSFKIIPDTANNRLTATFEVRNVTVDSDSFLVQAQTSTESMNDRMPSEMNSENNSLITRKNQNNANGSTNNNVNNNTNNNNVNNNTSNNTSNNTNNSNTNTGNITNQ